MKELIIDPSIGEKECPYELILILAASILIGKRMAEEKEKPAPPTLYSWRSSEQAGRYSVSGFFTDPSIKVQLTHTETQVIITGVQYPPLPAAAA